MGIGLKCFQCKVQLSGKKKARQHGETTGHTWKPGHYCTDCEATFSTRKLCKQHVQEAGVHSKAKSAPPKKSTVLTPGPSSSSTSNPPALTPSKPIPLAIALVAPLGPNTSSSGASVIGSKDESLPLRCTMCPMTFSSQETLERHLARVFTCMKCSLHFYESEKLQDHYRTSSAHPRCRECGQGFSTLGEWAVHRARCPPPVPLATESTQSTSTPRSLSDGFSIVSTSAAEEFDAVSHDSTVIEPSEASSLAPRTRSPSRDPEGVTVTSDNGDLQPDGIDASVGTPETFVTAEPFATEKQHLDANVRALQDKLTAPKADKGKNKAPPNNKIATPAPAPARPEGGPKKTAANLPSFHCRSCLADRCVKPVATLCGHIFCHSCIVRELAVNMCCPVCQRPFMVRLQVDS